MSATGRLGGVDWFSSLILALAIEWVSSRFLIVQCSALQALPDDFLEVSGKTQERQHHFLREGIFSDAGNSWAEFKSWEIAGSPQLVWLFLLREILAYSLYPGFAHPAYWTFVMLGYCSELGRFWRSRLQFRSLYEHAELSSPEHFRLRVPED